MSKQERHFVDDEDYSTLESAAKKGWKSAQEGFKKEAEACVSEGLVDRLLAAKSESFSYPGLGHVLRAYVQTYCACSAQMLMHTESI